MAKAQDTEFLLQQMKYERVYNAFSEKEDLLKAEFVSKDLAWPPTNIYIRAFKAESVLEIWVSNNDGYTKFKTYNICKPSGNFGPKRKEGDFQVPEGLYEIDRFNPVSNFLLSLGINYPNESDLVLSDKNRPGGDIFIHGDCVTIGCMPMTNDKIKEIYILAVLARNAGQETIKVHSFPFMFNTLNNYIFYKEFPQHKQFWENLKPAYSIFEEQGIIPNFYIDSNGNYVFS